jgi:hypothetical protein
MGPGRESAVGVENRLDGVEGQAKQMAESKAAQGRAHSGQLAGTAHGKPVAESLDNFLLICCVYG